LLYIPFTECDGNGNEGKFMKTFSTKDISEILDIAPNCIRQWIHKGYVRPSVVYAINPGGKHLFSYNDLCGISIFKKLVELYQMDRSIANLYFSGWQKTMKNISYERKNDLTCLIFAFRAEYHEKSQEEELKYYVIMLNKEKEENSPGFIYELLEDFEELKIFNVRKLFEYVDNRIARWKK